MRMLVDWVKELSKFMRNAFMDLQCFHYCDKKYERYPKQIIRASRIRNHWSHFCTLSRSCLFANCKCIRLQLLTHPLSHICKKEKHSFYKSTSFSLSLSLLLFAPRFVVVVLLPPPPSSYGLSYHKFQETVDPYH
jgi:hypothetical protein